MIFWLVEERHMRQISCFSDIIWFLRSTKLNYFSVFDLVAYLPTRKITVTQAARKMHKSNRTCPDSSTVQLVDSMKIHFFNLREIALNCTILQGTFVSSTGLCIESKSDQHRDFMSMGRVEQKRIKSFISTAAKIRCVRDEVGKIAPSRNCCKGTISYWWRTTHSRSV